MQAIENDVREGAIPGFPAAIPFTLSQERLLFSKELLQRLGTPPAPDFIHICLSLAGDLNVGALQEALTEMARRHSGLRTLAVRNPAIPAYAFEAGLAAFIRTGIAPRAYYVQEVHEPGEVALSYVDLSAEPSADHDAGIRNILQRESATPLDTRTGLALRATLIRRGPQGHVLIVTVDHLVCDGWSAKLIRDEIEKLYRHFAEGAPALAMPAMGQADFALWQEQALQTGAFEDSLA